MTDMDLLEADEFVQTLDCRQLKTSNWSSKKPKKKNSKFFYETNQTFPFEKLYRLLKLSRVSQSLMRWTRSLKSLIKRLKTRDWMRLIRMLNMSRLHESALMLGTAFCFFVISRFSWLFFFIVLNFYLLNFKNVTLSSFLEHENSFTFVLIERLASQSSPPLLCGSCRQSSWWDLLSWDHCKRFRKVILRKFFRLHSYSSMVRNEYTSDSCISSVNFSVN